MLAISKPGELVAMRWACAIVGQRGPSYRRSMHVPIRLDQASLSLRVQVSRFVNNARHESEECVGLVQ
jgi:hypothetical protein